MFACIIILCSISHLANVSSISPTQFRLHVPEEMIEDEDGFRTAGITGKDFLWKCWLKNKDPPAVLRKRAMGALWKLSPADRKAQKLMWQHQIYESEREEVALALKTIKTARDELKGLQQTTDANILSKARVIGCTTTKAAMCKSLLNGVGAEILLVEEAGEIREADVLTWYVCAHLIGLFHAEEIAHDKSPSSHI